jgi:hypothetical protein
MLREQLESEAAKLIERRDDLLAAADRVPSLIDTEELAGKVGDFVKQLTGAHKTAEAARVAAKEPHLESTRVVDGFFKQITDPLANTKRMIEARLGAYLKQKADEERRQREAAAQLAREKAAAEWRAAQEAERQRQAAAAGAAAKAQPVPAPTAVQVEQHLDAAHQHENEASQLTAAAQASDADLSRVRGDYGSVQSLRTTIEFEIVDAGSIPIEAIRPYLPRAAIETAIRGFVRTIDASAIKRLGETGVLPGVRIFEKHTASVR